MNLNEIRIGTILCVLSLTTLVAQVTSSEFTSRWNETADRVWIGPDYWANRLHDWRIADPRAL